jgi:hypothetical protein
LAFSGVIEFQVSSLHFLSATAPELPKRLKKFILKAISFALYLAPQAIGHVRPVYFISLFQEMDKISFSFFAFFMAKP